MSDCIHEEVCGTCDVEQTECGYYEQRRGKCKIINETCSRCGAIIHESANMYWQHLDGGVRTVKHRAVNFCPNCGREVEC